MNKEPTYSEAYSELEAIVAEIESATIDIEELSVKVKRASWLLRFCREKLLKTEADVNEALGKDPDGQNG